jgi:hypothetical protein
MKCPHCHENFNERLEQKQFPIGGDCDGAWQLTSWYCPSCERLVFALVQLTKYSKDGYPVQCGLTTLCRPKTSLRPPPPKEVPEQIAVDYSEACLVLPDSAQASAALSRRCLQYILREAEKVKPGNLSSEIQQVLDKGKLPSHIAESLDAVRAIGNFAAHPIKSTSTGEIVPVEAGEAEWNLDVLEALFDFYFVQPEVIKKKRAALNTKLKDAGNLVTYEAELWVRYEMSARG